ncbi:MAG: UDP-N-acetylmuramoyl-L-alanyl-D-glutamate--2,6-diaminopimelate ligase [Bacteriovoracaceae bacterium]
MNKLKQSLKDMGLPADALEKIHGIEWRAQAAKPTDVLFYRLGATEKESIENFKKRAENSNYGLLIVASKTSFALNSLKLRNCYFLSEEQFFELRLKLADVFYPVPANLKIIAVTGTNGKTTTVDIIRQLLAAEGAGVLTIGTLGVCLNDKKVKDFNLTSPDFIDLRKVLFEYGREVEVCALEASSHAIAQNRLSGLSFASIGWTSFSQDHLDYHSSLEEYFEVKKSLLNHSKKSFVVSRRAGALADQIGERVSLAKKASPPSGDFFKSEFNMVNLEVALGCLEDIGIVFEPEELDRLQPPPGRFNVIKDGARVFIIDFAHTPNALENICKELRASFPAKKLVAIFGCGGNRDRSKRPLMGKAAGDNADFVVLTSDNPRFEDPEKILLDIEPGLSHERYWKIVDREAAIKKAAETFSDAVILIAGKGHEEGIEMNGEKLPYSDRKALERIINK